MLAVGRARLDTEALGIAASFLLVAWLFAWKAGHQWTVAVAGRKPEAAVRRRRARIEWAVAAFWALLVGAIATRAGSWFKCTHTDTKGSVWSAY